MTMSTVPLARAVYIMIYNHFVTCFQIHELGFDQPASMTTRRRHIN